MNRQTVFSDCRQYRYTLWREWGDLFSGEDTYVQFIGLNPSTADEVLDDPTIRRCVQFAKDFGCRAMCMTNLFAWRATDPKEMKNTPFPIGDENDYWLREIASKAKVVIAAWGNDGKHRGRDAQVRKLIPNLHVLKINAKTGQPAHPLYLSAILRPIPWG